MLHSIQAWSRILGGRRIGVIYRVLSQSVLRGSLVTRKLSLGSICEIKGVPPGRFNGIQIANVTKLNPFGYPYRYLALDFSHGKYAHLNSDALRWLNHRNLAIRSSVVQNANLPANALKSGSKFIRGANKVAVPLAVAVDVYDLSSSAYQDYQQAGQLVFGDESKRAVGRLLEAGVERLQVVVPVPWSRPGRDQVRLSDAW